MFGFENIVVVVVIILLRYSGIPVSDAFYLTCIPPYVWFKPVPIGINTLAKTMNRIMSSIGDGKFYSNTSLRCTAKTRLIEAGIPKELGRKKTGHMKSELVGG